MSSIPPSSRVDMLHPPGGMEGAMPHHAHPDVIKCLKRASGHLDTIIEMIGGGGHVSELDVNARQCR